LSFSACCENLRIASPCKFLRRAYIKDETRIWENKA